MLQVLSIVAMEPPARFESRDVRDEKVKVLRAIAPFDAASVARDAVRGQYGPGWIAGDRVPGYREEKGVDPESNTDTFVAMRVMIDNWRWSGTPFYLRTGKRLPRRATEVAIQFKQAPHLPFAASAVESAAPNLLILRIQPDEGASLRFLAKVPGPQIDLRVVSMDFTYGNSFLRSSPEAYERLLLDALLGDSTLFARWDEVERAWEIMQGLIDEWSADAGAVSELRGGVVGPRGGRCPDEPRRPRMAPAVSTAVEAPVAPWDGVGVSIAEVLDRLAEQRRPPDGGAPLNLAGILNLVAYVPAEHDVAPMTALVHGLAGHQPARAVLVVEPDGGEGIDATVSTSCRLSGGQVERGRRAGGALAPRRSPRGRRERGPAAAAVGPAHRALVARRPRRRPGRAAGAPRPAGRAHHHRERLRRRRRGRGDAPRRVGPRRRRRGDRPRLGRASRRGGR